AAGDDEVAVACASLAQAGADSAGLITIFTGDGAAVADADPLLRAIDERFADAATEVYEGGQPHYRFVISVE
ncbi:MAG: hypothetical protein ACR2OO_13175, partial [Thermomicrobiales bacterium]